MIPFLTTDMLLNLMTRGNPPPRTLNADYAWHLDTLKAEAAVVVRDAWPLRLLPQALRAPIKARLAARKYESTLIKMWDISPHLIADIGLTFDPVRGTQDHLIAAPARLVAHVAARGPLPTERQPHIKAADPDLTVAAPAAPRAAPLAPAATVEDCPSPKQTQVAA